MKTKLEDVLEPIKGIDNISLNRGTDEPLIIIPMDKSYVEILGHRIEVGEGGFKSFGEFVEWLEHIKDVETENEQLKKQMAEIGEYVRTKYEEAKLDAQYYDGMRFSSMQERIYEDIFNRMELN